MATGDAKTTGKAKPSGQKPTNTTLGSVAVIKHSEPIIELYGRVAVDEAISMLNPKAPSLHFTIVISDDYSGITSIDGQPILKNMTIKTNHYKNELPKKPVLVMTIHPPENMSNHIFAQRLIEGALAFPDGVLSYSFPDKVTGAVMDKSQYNSSSYVAGLLGSVIGHVPKISVPGYQTPGWENPIPFHYFRRH